MNINKTVNEIKTIQKSGVYLTQYFSFWQNIFGQNSANVNERFQMSPGFVLVMVLIVGLFIWCSGKANFRIKFLTLFSLFFLFISSNLFPWDFIAEYSSIGNFLAQVQFPWRYLGIVIIFLTLLLGELIELMINKYQNISKESVYLIIYMTCIVMICWFSSNYCNNLGIVNYYDTADLNNKRIHGGAEYLLANTNRNLLSNDIVSKNIEYVKLIKRVGNTIELSCSVGKKEGEIELPLYNYRGYKIMDQDGNQYSIYNGNNNVVAFALPAGFSGVITVKFVEPWYWKVALYVSFLFALLIGILKNRSKNIIKD